jgi:uncharacterized membrane protein
MNDKPRRSGMTDDRMEIWVGNLLRAGVLLAGVIVLIGGIIYLVRHGGQLPDYRIFHGQPSELRFMSGIFQDAVSLSGRGVIQLGFLVLIATPVMRVLVSGVAFALERDWLYVVVVLIVLAVLLYSLIFGGQA